MLALYENSAKTDFVFDRPAAPRCSDDSLLPISSRTSPGIAPTDIRVQQCQISQGWSSKLIKIATVP
jgi:hypothetical protein